MPPLMLQSLTLPAVLRAAAYAVIPHAAGGAPHRRLCCNPACRRRCSVRPLMNAANPQAADSLCPRAGAPEVGRPTAQKLAVNENLCRITFDPNSSLALCGRALVYYMNTYALRTLSHASFASCSFWASAFLPPLSGCTFKSTFL